MNRSCGLNGTEHSTRSTSILKQNEVDKAGDVVASVRGKMVGNKKKTEKSHFERRSDSWNKRRK